MRQNENKYIRDLEISFILILLFFTIIFYFFPKFDRITPDLLPYNIPAIEVIHIPITNHSQKRKLPPLKPIIPIEADIVEFLDYVEIEEVMLGDSSISRNLSGPVYYTKLPFTPRQLYDVMPEKNDEFVTGSIVVSLRIGKDGTVKEYKIVKNTTNCKNCLQNIIKAVQLSKWEPAIVDDHKIEYWIDKTYVF